MPAFAQRMEYMVGSAAIIRGLFGANERSLKLASFGNVSREKIEEGMKRLGDLI